MPDRDDVRLDCHAIRKRPMIDLNIEIAGIGFSNPVMAASGTFGYGDEYAGLIDAAGLGAIVTKGISLKPSPGNPPPRIAETPSGMLNAIGLHNVGLQRFVEDKIPFLRKCGTRVIVNFYGSTVSDYVHLAERLSVIDIIDALEVNISCPNIHKGGIAFGTDRRMAADLVRAVRKATAKPLIVKLSPNVTDIAEIAAAVEAAGADALSLVNTVTGMVIDTETCRPVLANGTGGLSGPAIRPIALRMVWQTVQRVSIPVIGIGGILGPDDALQFLLAGARAVQIGTGLFVDPAAPAKIIQGISDYMRDRGYETVEQLIGRARC